MPDQRLDHLYPPFAAKVSTIVQEWTAWCDTHKPGYHALLAEGFRTRDRQAALYAQGRTSKGAIVTQKNGASNPSNHQSCMAADIVLAKGTEIAWDLPADDPAWAYLGHMARLHNLQWGGDWPTFKDIDHVEWPTTDDQAYFAARHWKAERGLV